MDYELLLRLKETAEENAKSIIEGLLYPILESQKYKLVWE